MVKPLPFVSVSELTREGIKSFVEAQKALMDVVRKPTHGATHETKTHTTKAHRRARRSVHHAKAAAATAA
jgi:hypothetical protein